MNFNSLWRIVKLLSFKIGHKRNFSSSLADIDVIWLGLTKWVADEWLLRGIMLQFYAFIQIFAKFACLHDLMHIPQSRFSEFDYFPLTHDIQIFQLEGFKEMKKFKVIVTHICKPFIYFCVNKFIHSQETSHGEKIQI